MYIYIDIDIDRYRYLYIYIYTYISIYTCIYIHRYIHIYTDIYIHICIYTYLLLLLLLYYYYTTTGIGGFFGIPNTNHRKEAMVQRAVANARCCAQSAGVAAESRLRTINSARAMTAIRSSPRNENARKHRSHNASGGSIPSGIYPAPSRPHQPQGWSGERDPISGDR